MNGWELAVFRAMLWIALVSGLALVICLMVALSVGVLVGTLRMIDNHKEKS